MIHRKTILYPMLGVLSLVIAACGQNYGHDPRAGELQGLIDLALNVTDLACPAVEDSAPFRQRAANPIYEVNESEGTIRLTEAGVTQAAYMALGAVETGMCFPELQKVADTRLPMPEIRAAREAAEAEYQRLRAGKKSYSRDCQTVLAIYGSILEKVDKIVELVEAPGQNPHFYVQYGAARELLNLQLEEYSILVASRPEWEPHGLAYTRSRERYMQAAADYMLSPARELMKGKEGS